MTSLKRYLAAWAYQNAWANHRLLGACQKLGPGEFAAVRTGYFPSLKATLNHIVTVDWLYADAIERALDGREPNPNPGAFFDPAEPFDDAIDLADEQEETDRRFIAICERLREDQLEMPVAILRRQGRVEESLHRLLAHVFQHQIHHRGQAHAMLAGSSVAPPQLDEFFCEGDAPLRAAELSALGFSDAAIWGR